MFINKEAIHCSSEKVRDCDLRNENKVYSKNAYLSIIVKTEKESCASPAIISKTSNMTKGHNLIRDLKGITGSEQRPQGLGH